MLTLAARKSAASDLLDARKRLAALASHQVGQRVLVQRQIEALQAMVTGKAAKAINLLTPAQTVAELSRLWEGMKGAAPEDRTVAAQHMRIILRYANNVARQQGAGLTDEARELDTRLWQEAAEAEKPEFQMGQASRWINSKWADQVQSVADAVAARASEVEEARAKHRARIDALRPLGRISDHPEVHAAGLAYNDARGREANEAAYAAYRAVFERVRSEAEAKINAGKAEADAELQAALDRMAESAQALKRQLLAASPISEEQGKAWAEAQEIDSAAKAAMKKGGYPVEAVRADVAEFYRLTGGRLAKVRIKASRGRASASGIHGHKDRTIRMGAGFNKETLFHELGHHLEADPQVYAAAAGFLLKRRESPQKYTLRSLTGNPGYKSDEVAYRDKWFNPYVGKVYRDNVTEVFSMGMESFASPAALAQRVAVDPEHFKLMAGFLDTLPSELLDAVKEVLGQAAEVEDEAAEQAEATKEEALKRIADGVKLIPGGPPEFQPWEIRKGGATYEGRIDGADAVAHVYAGKFRDYSGTRRMKKGWGVVMFHKGNGSLILRAYFDRTEALAAARVVAETAYFPSGSLSELQRTAEALQA